MWVGREREQSWSGLGNRLLLLHSVAFSSELMKKNTLLLLHKYSSKHLQLHIFMRKCYFCLESMPGILNCNALLQFIHLVEFGLGVVNLLLFLVFLYISTSPRIVSYFFLSLKSPTVYLQHLLFKSLFFLKSLIFKKKSQYNTWK